LGPTISEDLLNFVERGKVIPVIGEHAVSFGEGNEPLYPFLARELDSAWCKRRTGSPRRPHLINDVIQLCVNGCAF